MNSVSFRKNHGIEMLRILSMLFVVILHVIGPDGILYSQDRTINYKVAWIIEIAAYCAVNCYALISGYVGIKAKHKYTNIIILWIQIVFLNLLMKGMECFLEGQSFRIREWIKVFLPILTNQYWYFTAYFCLFFFIPAYNFLINDMPKEKIKLLIKHMLVLFCVIPLFGKIDLFNTNLGYSFLWISSLYLIGGYIRKYNPFEKVDKENFIIIYILCISFTWGWKMLSEDIGLMYDIRLPSDLFIEYVSPTIVIAAISLLSYFERIKIENEVLKKNILKVSSCTFGVYIIHQNSYVADKIKNYFNCSFSDISLKNMILYIFLFSGLI